MWDMILDMLLFEDGVLLGILFWIVVILIVFVLLLIGIVIAECVREVYVKINTDEVIEENAMTTVKKKEYIPGYTSVISAGKCLVPIRHSASYCVHLECEGEEFVLDGEQLYYQVKENEKIPAKLFKYLSKEGNVLKKSIKVEEDS